MSKRVRKWKMWAVVCKQELLEVSEFENYLQSKWLVKPIRVEVRELPKRKPNV